MPLRRVNLEMETIGANNDGQFTPPSSTTTTSRISDENTFHQNRNEANEQLTSLRNDLVMPIGWKVKPLGRPTNEAVSALAKRLFQSSQNEQINYDEENSERSQIPQNKEPVKRATSASRNGSVNGDNSQSSQVPLRRNSRVSNHFHGSMTNISEFGAAPMVIYDPFVLPPPMLSRAPSMSQMWFPQPPPIAPFSPYYYGPSPFTIPPPPLNPREMRKAIKEARKIEKKRKLEADIAENQVGFSYYCCDGVAQLLWVIIVVTLLGFASALILALFIL